MKLAFNPSSRLAFRTRAVGLLARLGHNLEIEVTAFQGQVDLDDTTWVAELLIEVAGLHVAGTVVHDRLDTRALSQGDVIEVERRLHTEILGDTQQIRVVASGDSLNHADVCVALARAKTDLAVPLTTEKLPDGGFHISGRCALSLRALGIPEVKAPLGAFKVDDKIDVQFDYSLLPISGSASPRGHVP